MKYEVTAIGNCVIDYFILAKSQIIKNHIRKDNHPDYLAYVYGDKIGVEEFTDDMGGESCNAAVALKKIGINSSIASVIGDDIYSRDLLKKLKKEKIGIRFLAKEKNKKLGISFILLGPDRDRTILAYREKNNFKKINYKKLFSSSKSFYFAGINKYSSCIQDKLLEHIKKTNKPLYLNPSIFQIEKTPVILKKIMVHSELFCVNIEEAKKILNINTSNRDVKKDVKKILKEIKKLGPKIVIITDSVRGSYAYDGDLFLKSGIYPSERVDTTGAGDSFFAGFVAAYKKGYNIERCLKYGTINASGVVSKYGAQRGLLNEKEIIKRFNKNKVRVSKI
uniref:Carbohydrate kinase family protein n=1 Tax=candidate division CPR3 bacterium TaxID=2268181 RepID=A0A7C4R5H4_UNCC3